MKEPIGVIDDGLEWYLLFLDVFEIFIENFVIRPKVAEQLDVPLLVRWPQA